MPFFSKHSLIAKLRELGFDPSKDKGQNYLIDPDVCSQFVNDIPLNPNQDKVLEIGPGMGAYSDLLAERSKQFFLIEIESGCAKFLETYFSAKYPTIRILGKKIDKEKLALVKEKIVIIEGDVLKVPLPDVTHVFSSTPYSICYELVLKLIQNWQYDHVHLILQKDFVDRLIAKENERGYNVLAAFCGLYVTPTVVRNIWNEAFYPAPDVENQIVDLIPNSVLTQHNFSKQDQSQYLLFLRELFFEMTWPLEKAVNRIIEKQSILLQEFPNLKKLKESNLVRKQLRQISPNEYFELMKLAQKNNKI
jgi:16S rRNA (adenine1518-N6/adenine1519-N6)-dimethyltransferase